MLGHAIVLDTCALRDKVFMDWLKGYTGDIRIPPVVYMEMCRQQTERGLPVAELDEWLRIKNISVLRFDKNDARIAAELMAGRGSKPCGKCGKMDWFDAIVASHFDKGDYLITNNRDGFPTSGVFEGRILTTDEFMSRRH
ncbi:MAG: PIN domain-containing protein [Methanomassiliicoccaceae archaeon]|nr:PIN domain-containing protein [Methanomassiliicoccaceae archaeon]